MKSSYILLFILSGLMLSCSDTETPEVTEIQGFSLLNDLNGHWVGSNETSFGFYDWFAFDFRPISPSHCHSIYEGATNQNIINSVFVADHEGVKKLYARNGGWLGTQYRATYFVLDRAEESADGRYYRLVDAIGGADRAYVEYRFKEDSIYFDAYKDNSGTLDKPILHMAFRGANRNKGYAQAALTQFDYPQETPELSFDGAFDRLIDPDSALFLEENADPFPKSAHGYVSDLEIAFLRQAATTDQDLLLFISKEQLVNSEGITDNQKIDDTVIRTIDIRDNENSYLATYLHPDDYYITIFLDVDGNGFPSAGDISSASQLKTVLPETEDQLTLELNLTLR